MTSIVKLTKQGVRDLDSGRKKIRVVAPVLENDEAAHIAAEADLKGEEPRVVAPQDDDSVAVPVPG